MHIEVSIFRQSLRLLGEDGVLAVYPVSTAINGAGESKGSACTPRGKHVVRAKIGAGQPLGAVFIGRRPTGEIWTPQLAVEFPARDWILTRILWLSGCEIGFNRLGDCDTMQRYIYIHGTPDTEPMSVPRSHGCIRMCNADVLDLFEKVQAGTPVLINGETVA
jgi:L,D-transpeptidase YbiS